MKTVECINKFIRDERGAELAEYAVGAALVVAIAVVVYEILGNAILDSNSGTAARVDGAAWTPPSP